MGGREEGKKIACLLSLRRRRLPSVPLSLHRRRQRCLRPLNPALERERTKGRDERRRERRRSKGGGPTREREERKEAPILAWLYRSSDSPLRSFSRRLIASVGPSVGRGRCECGGAAGRLVESLFSGGETFLLFYGSLLPPSQFERTREGRHTFPLYLRTAVPDLQTYRHASGPAPVSMSVAD